MRKGVAVFFVFLVMLVMPMSVQAMSTPVYESEQAALQSELQHLRETVTEPGVYSIVLRFYDADGTVIEQEIFLEITADDTLATVTESYAANERNGWFGNYNGEDATAWTGFGAFITETLPFILMLIMLVPFLVLLLMSLLTSKLTRDVNSVLGDE
ncbi:hypothetical protein [Culicoidibacter larvae]|uniref:Uncharacterized protein n=1 Tax=Culicoidibacter larvae TaxID=2579976 RepID=A0A5R8Q6M3_9FIRM|nr:hypothetical protein [Culicoidibacter larvae]TLG70276.1 hypothetical protein FEZ08_11970 [Culicoidibacter larvae]